MIEIQHLKKQYESATPLSDVNVTINQGDVIAVIGPSGTGKSTLLRCINLLEQPTAGRILVDGEDITNSKCDINRVRLKLSMVFQSFNLYEHLTVVENCMIAQTTLLKRAPQEAYNKAMDLLASVGMDDRALQYPYQLSGGQKQRVAIARALSTDPEIILFDEPTSALDPLTVGEVENVIADLAKQGRTMMIVTHSMDFAQSVSNRVFYMDQGGIYEDGTPEQIFNNPQKERTRRFIRRLACLELVTSEEQYNLSDDLKKIQEFCNNHKLDIKRTLNTCNAYEEACNMMFKYIEYDDKTLHIKLEYQINTNKLTLSFAPSTCYDLDQITDSIYDSPEFSLLMHYATNRYREQSDDGIGVRYTLEL